MSPRTHISLEAMARRLSRMADDMFSRCGELPHMLWYLDAADEMGMHMLVVPAIEEQREVIPVALRKYFAEHGVTRFVSATECWYSSVPNEGGVPPVLVVRPSLDPQRKEGVSIRAEDESKRLTGLREIIRPPNGKPYLSKLELMEDHWNIGRLTNLLPGRAEMTHH
jgi:hypothetical protein